jgi:hypothetical protein
MRAPTFPGSISDYSLLLRCISDYICSLASSPWLESLLSLEVQQLDITILSFDFLVFVVLARRTSP